MGFNTTVLIMNDALCDIENDAAFGRKLSRAITALHASSGPVDVSANGFVNAATAIESHHADGTALVAVGRNNAENLGVFFPYGDKIKLLKDFAASLGYDIRKKRKR